VFNSFKPLKVLDIHVDYRMIARSFQPAWEALFILPGLIRSMEPAATEVRIFYDGNDENKLTD